MDVTIGRLQYASLLLFWAAYSFRIGGDILVPPDGSGRGAALIYLADTIPLLVVGFLLIGIASFQICKWAAAFWGRHHGR